MLHLVLVMAISNGDIVVPKKNAIDLQVFEAIRKLAEQYHEEEKRRRRTAGQAGCPFEPGTYDNVECV